VTVAVTKIRAPTAGTVVSITAPAGTRVAKDQELLIFESMKLEIPVESPAGGTVAKVYVAAGQEIQENDVLVDLAT
jgi:acetyl-CoA carboxylase biotin carboxyl carrier protein